MSRQFRKYFLVISCRICELFIPSIIAAIIVRSLPFVGADKVILFSSRRGNFFSIPFVFALFFFLCFSPRKKEKEKEISNQTSQMKLSREERKNVGLEYFYDIQELALNKFCFFSSTKKLNICFQ